MTADLALYLAIARRRAWLILGCGLAALLLSLAAIALRPPVYTTQLQVLVTRAETARAGFGATASGEDRAAQDLPAILAGEPFRRDLDQRLGAAMPIPADMLTAEVAGRSVLVTVRAGAAGTVDAAAAAVPELLRANGLAYWGDPQAKPGDAGLNVALLAAPAPAARTGGLRQLALEVALRTLAGLALGMGAALALHALRRTA